MFLFTYKEVESYLKSLCTSRNKKAVKTCFTYLIFDLNVNEDICATLLSTRGEAKDAGPPPQISSLKHFNDTRRLTSRFWTLPIVIFID